MNLDLINAACAVWLAKNGLGEEKSRPGEQIPGRRAYKQTRNPDRKTGIIKSK